VYPAIIVCLYEEDNEYNNNVGMVMVMVQHLQMLQLLSAAQLRLSIAMQIHGTIWCTVRYDMI
jgi:hypothetical protein